jgi:hypothetical protein
MAMAREAYPRDIQGLSTRMPGKAWVLVVVSTRAGIIWERKFVPQDIGRFTRELYLMGTGGE